MKGDIIMSKKTLYQFNGEIYETLEEVEDEAYYLACETYDDILDECYEEVLICGCTYSPSIALKRTDEVRYRCGLLDYASSLSEDIEEIEVDENELEI